jgi:hypothetical protein
MENLVLVLEVFAKIVCNFYPAIILGAIAMFIVTLLD